jgi:hypothetical protein
VFWKVQDSSSPEFSLSENFVLLFDREKKSNHHLSFFIYALMCTYELLSCVTSSLVSGQWTVCIYDAPFSTEKNLQLTHSIHA